MKTQIQKPSDSKYHSSRKMLSVQFYGNEKVKVKESPIPLVTDNTDAIIKVTASTICGSDLQLYHNMIPDMKDGDILGHESVGIVDEVGPEVKKFKKGDRVVISPIIACGQCEYCRRKEWSCCDTTNPNVEQEELYGHHIGGLLGYSRSFGGYDGCQAEFVRVPFADVNLFPIPNNISDREALCVADVASRGYHGASLADIQSGDKVVVFGCGSVGLMAQMWSQYLGASKIVVIDVDKQRLDFARKNFGCETINAKEEDQFEAVKKFFPGGPDKVIDCVGSHFPDTLIHKAEKVLKLEKDSPNVVNAAIKMVRKNGRITLLGDYAGYTNHFNIGGLMEKHLTINGGQLWPHNYYKLIFEAMASGKVNPSIVFTHNFPLSKAAEAYKEFDRHEGGMIKPFLVPDSLFTQTE